MWLMFWHLTSNAPFLKVRTESKLHCFAKEKSFVSADAQGEKFSFKALLEKKAFF